MSLFGAFGAGCAAISSRTAAVRTSRQGKVRENIFGRILRESSFSTGVVLSSSSSFYYLPMPRRGWLGGGYDSLKNLIVVFDSLEVTSGFTP